MSHVGRLGAVADLVDQDLLDAVEPLQDLGRVGVAATRDRNSQAHPPRPVQPLQELQDVDLRSRDPHAQAGAVHGHREVGERSDRDGQRLVQGPASQLGHRLDPAVVVRVALGQQPLVVLLQPGRPRAEGLGTLVEDEHVVRDHVGESSQQAALREVHLFAVAR